MTRGAEAAALAALRDAVTAVLGADDQQAVGLTRRTHLAAPARVAP